MRRLSVFLMAMGLLALAAPLAAQQPIVIELEGVLEGPVDTVVPLTSVAVDPALVGGTCTGTAQTENNASVHPDNDVILASGGTSAEFTGVEDAPGLLLTLEGSLVLGETIDVSLRFGPDEITSLGIVVTLDCAPPVVETTTTTTEPPATTTTAPPETTTTTAPPETTTTTAAPPTTSSTAAPAGGVATGAGGTAGGSNQLGVVALGLAAVAVAGVGGVGAWRRRSQS